MKTAWVFCGAVLLSGVTVTAGAAGQPRTRGQSGATGDDSTVRDVARLEFERGVAAALERRWDEAVRSFQRARDLRATPSVYFNLGLACRSAGRYRDGIQALETFLGAPGASPDPHRVRAASEALGAMRSGLARLTLMVTPERARVRVDGTDVPTAGTVELDPGEHSVGAEAEGHVARSESVRLAEAEARVLSLRLEAVQPAVSPTSLHEEGPAQVPPRSRRALWAWIGVGAGVLAVVLVTSLVVVLSSDEPPAQGALGHVTDAVTAR